MQINAHRARVLAVNADTLLTLGVKHCAIGICKECDTPYLAEFADALVVCGYCGAEFLLNPDDVPSSPLPILTPQTADGATLRA